MDRRSGLAGAGESGLKLRPLRRHGCVPALSALHYDYQSAVRRTRNRNDAKAQHTVLIEFFVEIVKTPVYCDGLIGVGAIHHDCIVPDAVKTRLGRHPRCALPRHVSAAEPARPHGWLNLGHVDVMVSKPVVRDRAACLKRAA
jgi:hypothetical protein